MPHDATMSEQPCRVCGTPVELGASRCVNCGAEVREAPGSTSAGASNAGAKRGPLTFAAIAIGLAGAGAGVVLSTSAEEAGDSTFDIEEEARPDGAEAPEEPQIEEARPVEKPEPPTQSPSDLAEAVEGEAAEEPPLNDVKVTLSFGARVVSASGKKLAPGSRCQIGVHVLGERIKDLNLACGDLVLYDSRTPLNGMSTFGTDLLERRKGQGWVYRVVYSDIGMRSSRSQLRMNSTREEARVFSESADAFDVELKVDEFSEPRTGDSLLNTPQAPVPLGVALTLTSHTGVAPEVDKACKLTSHFVEGSRGGALCKTELRCGNKTLYGKGDSLGFASCEFAGGAIARFSDDKETHEDGDPSLTVDVNEETAKLTDSPGQMEYSLVFAFGE